MTLTVLRVIFLRVGVGDGVLGLMGGHRGLATDLSRETFVSFGRPRACKCFAALSGEDRKALLSTWYVPGVCLFFLSFLLLKL